VSATVAIAPFDNLSGDPAQDYFARGFVEDIATELSRFATLEVLHPRAFGATPAADGSPRPAPAPHVVAADSAPATFRRDGPLWTMVFGGVSVQLTHQKGFLDLAQLLARPGVEMHCLELAERPAEPTGYAPMLDDRARRELKARVRDLQHEIDDADAACDLGRAEAARQELDQIVEHLSDAVGLAGRARHLGSAAERARSAVTWRIRSAIRKIAATHTRLGRHFENAVRTGTFCVYEPESPTTWTL